MAWRLADADVARDEGAEYGFVEEAANFVDDFAGEVEFGVVHGEDDSADFEAVVVSGLGLACELDDLGEAFHGEIFALDGDEDFVGGGEGGAGELAEGGRAVEEDEVEAVELVVELVSEGGGALAIRGGERVGIGEAEGAWEDVEVGDGGFDHGIGEGASGDEWVTFGGGDAEAAGGVALGVDVDDERRPARLGESGGDVNGGGGLADPALLVGHGDDLGHVEEASSASLNGVWKRR